MQTIKYALSVGVALGALAFATQASATATAIGNTDATKTTETIRGGYVKPPAAKAQVIGAAPVVETKTPAEEKSAEPAAAAPTEVKQEAVPAETTPEEDKAVTK